MKIWTSEHTFAHSWETVVQAAWRKYPNPMNPSVSGLDVVSRLIDTNGRLNTHRLMTTEWGLPNWANKIIGMDRPCYGSEHSVVDPVSRTMKMRTRNLTFSNVITIDETLVYSSHPQNKNQTILKQEAHISIHGVPLASYLENLVVNTCSSNAGKGRQAMEWVIGKIKSETEEFSRNASHAGILPDLKSSS